MKILLIASNTATTPYAVYPLGLSMIAASLKQANHQVTQFDFLASGKSIPALQQTVREFAPDLIGISIRNIDNVNLINEQRYLDVVKDIVKELRLISPAKIVLGGSGFSIMPEEILSLVMADYGIVGEGESLFVEFINNISRGIYPKQPILRADAKLSGTQIPAADYNKSILQFYCNSGNIISLQTKRGCGHKCIYCSYPLLEGQTIRCRDITAVIDDIETLIIRHSAKYIFFTDSVFNDQEGNYLLLVKEMKKRKINIPWTAFFQPQGLDRSAIELMKETGLKAAEIGADACCDTTLKKLGKTFSFSQIINCNELFAQSEIATAHYFMMGTPGETKATVLEGINNIKNLTKTVSFIFMGIRILPGTLLADLALKQGLINADHNFLEPIYYLAPEIDRAWLEPTLTAAFKNNRNCVFPPDLLDNSLSFLHKLGYSGSLWEMLIPNNRPRKRKVYNAGK